MYKGYFLWLCVFAIGLIVISPGFSAMTDGLVGLWLFDEGSGQTAVDSSGNGYDGALMGSASWAGGKFNSALSTDGAEGYVEIADDPAFEFAGDFTIACWVQNQDPPPDNSSFVTKGYSRPGGEGGDARPWYLLYFLTSGTVDMFLRDSGGTNSRAQGAAPVNDGEWHHVVGVKDGDEVKVYIDGNEDAVTPAVDAVYGENDQPLVFMVHFDRWFAGMLDEVAIYERALSEDEIATAMSGLSGVIAATEPKGKLAVTWCELKSH